MSTLAPKLALLALVSLRALVTFLPSVAFKAFLTYFTRKPRKARGSSVPSYTCLNWVFPHIVWWRTVESRIPPVSRRARYTQDELLVSSFSCGTLISYVTHETLEARNTIVSPWSPGSRRASETWQTRTTRLSPVPLDTRGIGATFSRVSHRASHSRRTWGSRPPWGSSWAIRAWCTISTVTSWWSILPRWSVKSRQTRYASRANKPWHAHGSSGTLLSYRSMVAKVPSSTSRTWWSLNTLVPWEASGALQSCESLCPWESLLAFTNTCVTVETLLRQRVGSGPQQHQEQRDGEPRLGVGDGPRHG